MTTNEIITLIAILVGPLAAVAVTAWNEARRQKRAHKLWIFTQLMAHRKSNPIASDWVTCLNQVDVVFYDAPEVIEAWHSYYDELDRNADHGRPQVVGHRMLELLHEMAQHLGYPKLKQTDIDRFYNPDAFRQSNELDTLIRLETHRVLSNTATFLLTPKTSTDDSQAQPVTTSTSVVKASASEPVSSPAIAATRRAPSKKKPK